jgi:hypothetical protein
LYIDSTGGQPADDEERHGGREYGEAWWKDPTDADKLKGIAWTAVCFRKFDVRRLWPAEEGISPTTTPRKKGSPSLQRAHDAIRELYPHGVPDQATEPNAVLCRRVGEKLKIAQLPDVSDDTILRAAGRRK